MPDTFTCHRLPAAQNGRLSQWKPADLGGAVIKEVLKRAGIDTESTHPQKEGQASIVDDVVVGCTGQAGRQAGNIGRYMVLAAGLPESVPATTVDRACGSSLQAIQFAAQAVMSGVQDVVIAAGVESMSQIPMGSSISLGLKAGLGRPEDADGIGARYYPGIEFTQFESAEMVANKYQINRKEMEELAVASHARATQATKEGRFKREILPLMGVNRGFSCICVVDSLLGTLKADLVIHFWSSCFACSITGTYCFCMLRNWHSWLSTFRFLVPAKTGEPMLHDTDEGIRSDTSLEGLAKLPTLKKGGMITAGLSSQICDGAAAVLIVNEAGLAKLRAVNPEIRPRAKIVALTVIAEDVGSHRRLQGT